MGDEERFEDMLQLMKLLNNILSNDDLNLFVGKKTTLVSRLDFNLCDSL